ncbi:metalloproteinase inhibitor 3-like [Ylistrum balloti]|uniref:metalloproteinase inhibitor 3-like n=1 Tax=Ylistrum balloti TaxID=509963 RepID=UPI002905F0BC|nr:metalloproteinase inhibitor 3-like [Ylistrum balloti]
MEPLRVMTWTTLVVLVLLVDGITSCYCPPMPFQDQFCNSPLAIKGFVESGEPVWYGFRREYTRYVVKIDHVFKKPASEMFGEKIVISVPYQPSMCGATLSEGQSYLLTGSYFPSNFEKYQTNACDLIDRYENLSAEEIEGISGGFGCNFNMQKEINFKTY